MAFNFSTQLYHTTTMQFCERIYFAPPRRYLLSALGFCRPYTGLERLAIILIISAYHQICLKLWSPTLFFQATWRTS